MPSIVLPSSSAHFNALPSVEEADFVKQKECNEAILACLCGLFVKHQAQETFGLTLVHQHFPLEQHEKLVNIGNVAVPVHHKIVTSDIVATRWAFEGQRIIPYEFTQGAKLIDVDQHRDFIQEIGNVLQHHGLSRNLGLCSLGSIDQHFQKPTMEFTSGRANVTLPFDVDPDGDTSIEASWQIFEGPGPEITAFGQCKGRCKTGPNTGHNKKHVNTRS